MSNSRFIYHLLSLQNTAQTKVCDRFAHSKCILQNIFFNLAEKIIVIYAMSCVGDDWFFSRISINYWEIVLVLVFCRKDLCDAKLLIEYEKILCQICPFYLDWGKMDAILPKMESQFCFYLAVLPRSGMGVKMIPHAKEG